VKACSGHGDLILDPFLGSGTTAEVALSLGRCVVGFEIKKEYCDIAVERIVRLQEERKQTLLSFTSLADDKGITSSSSRGNKRKRDEMEFDEKPLQKRSKKM